VSKADYETWITEKGTHKGKPYARRWDLKVPLNVARGLYHKLSDLQLREITNDLLAERKRRDRS
jgi:hypothetical protein